MTTKLERSQGLDFHSRYYCPNCGTHDTKEGDLYVKNTKEYMKGEKPIYYCTKCKTTFIIEEGFSTKRGSG